MICRDALIQSIERMAILAESSGEVEAAIVLFHLASAMHEKREHLLSEIVDAHAVCEVMATLRQPDPSDWPKEIQVG